jgi:hypothetical protein
VPERGGHAVRQMIAAGATAKTLNRLAVLLAARA